MAIGPRAAAEARMDALARAEEVIDGLIRDSTGERVVVAGSMLGITRREWETHLRSKYTAAGWKMAEWVYDPGGGGYVDLQS